jgi:hypothetical protein
MHFALLKGDIMQFKEGIGWKACYDEEREIYTAEEGGGMAYDLFEITKEVYDRLGQKGMSDAEKAKKYDQLAQGLGQLLNLEMKAEESAEPVLADRSALKASVLQSLSGLSECLAQMKAAIATEE